MGATYEMETPEFRTRGEGSLLTASRPIISNQYSVEFQKMPPSVMPAHLRRWHVLSLILSPDTAIERIGGERRRQGRFQRGDAGIYPAGMGERIVWHDKVEALHIHLNPIAIRTLARKRTGTEHIALRETFLARDSRLRELGFALRQAITLTGSLREQTVNGVMEETLAHLVDRYSMPETPVPHSESFGPEILEQIMTYVDENLSGKITLEEMARVTGLSKYHFARSFRAITGLSPHRYLLRCRIERAKYLLSREDYSLSSIAYHCGLADQSHLTRTLRQITGSTPAQYRARYFGDCRL